MVLRRISGVIFAVVVSFGAPSVGLAQDLSQVQAPAEFPPLSYSGTQYVDSRGCIFVRAGIDGAVTWVPRVTRQRVPICGAEPTFSEAELALPVIPDPPGTVPPGAEAPETQAAEALATPVVVPEVVATRPTARSTPVTTAAPKPVEVAVAPAPKALQVKPVAAPAPVQAPVAATTPTPKPVEQVAAVPRMATPVPEGYQRIRVSKVLDVSGGLIPAWKDGRLNPNRGLPKVAERVSTKVAPPPVAQSARAPEATAGRYVQVATFGVRANAEATARRLAKTGQPVRIGTVTRKGQPLTLVMMGPFASKVALNQAVSIARGSGFADAFIR